MKFDQQKDIPNDRLKDEYKKYVSDISYSILVENLDLIKADKQTFPSIFDKKWKEIKKRIEKKKNQSVDSTQQNSGKIPKNDDQKNEKQNDQLQQATGNEKNESNAAAPEIEVAQAANENEQGQNEKKELEMKKNENPIEKKGNTK